MSWPTVKIGDFADVKGGKRLPKGCDVQDEITDHPYLRVVDFTNDGLNAATVKYITKEAHDLVKRYVISDRDIYVSIAGTIGRVGIVPEHFSGANLTENAAKITNISENVLPDFLLFFLRSDVGQKTMQSSAGGTSQPKLALYKIAEIEFPLPDLSTQARIAAILSAYDDLIENNRQRIALLEQAARLLYREWFVHFRFPGYETAKIVDGLPEGWAKATLGDLAEQVDYGFTASANHKTDGPRFLRITDIVRGPIEWRGVPRCVIPDNKISKFALAEGDVVVARTGATTGWARRVGLLNEKAVFASYLVRFRFEDRINPYLPGIFMQSEGYKDHIRAKLGGAAQPNASAKVLGSVEMPVPAPALQKEFARVVDPKLQLINSLVAQNSKLAEARDLLLPRLMDGRIPV